MASSIEKTVDIESEKEKLREYENECREKFSTADSESMPEGEATHVENQQVTETIGKPSSSGHAHMEPISGFDEKPAKDLKVLSYHRKLAVLYELLSACLAAIPEDNKNASTQRRRGYDARYRVALRLLATWFDVKWVKVEAIETMVACSAMALLKAQESKEEAESSKSRWAKWRRGGIIGAAALTGGTLMAITGGLAAPAIAAGFGALAPTLGTLVPVIGASGFAAVATAAGSVVGSVAVAASFGAAGAGLTGTKVARRIGDVDEFEFKTIGENHNKGRLAVEILITGFVIEESDFFRPWEGEYNNLERYALQWESKHLIAVSYAIRNWLTSSIALELMKRGAMMTVLSSILAALAWPATLLALTHFIDSEWTIAVDRSSSPMLQYKSKAFSFFLRLSAFLEEIAISFLLYICRSDKAGILLAEVLQKGLQGHRPVTLVGFSLGARVIFKCLEILAASGNNAGLVERVVLLGAPIKIRDVNWEAVRKVVAGRFVNVYSTNDWMLGIVFRASLLTQGLAGIQPVDVPGVENVDVTELIDGHSAYLWTSQEILELLQLDTYYPVFGRASVKR
ncbi:transmembrane and coiled-coil domain-containing protein 4-like isoform X3 [Ipomoea triloba]|nr:transmembrane and coiled-coil domain-containing protein 4-like isoform X3 [Ipomoea triloba]